MKIKFTILLGIVIVLGSCSSSSYLADDVYYSPKDENNAAKNNSNEVATYAVAEAVPSNQGFESVTYTEPGSTVSGVLNGDTLELETFEYENGDKELVVNNYYDNYYSDNVSYSSRLNRFYGPSVGLGYYSPYYNPWSWGPSFSFGMGMGFGFGFGFGYGYGYGGGYYPGYPYYPYYPPYYGGGCYYPCSPYYGYGGGPVYISDGGGAGYTSTHRRSSATGREMNYGTGGTKSASFYDNTAARRRGATASAENTRLKSNTVTSAAAPGSRRNIDSRTVSAADVRTTRTLPSRNNKYAQTQNRSAASTANRTTQSSAKRIPSKTTQSAQTGTNRNAVQQGNTTQKRYIPRYSTPKTTTKPSYNSSANKRSVTTTRPSSVTRQGYVPSTNSRSSFSTPTRTNARSTTRSYSPSSSGRSYSSPSRSSGSSGRSYTPSSSSSGSRSSGSTSRSSGSSSSGGRRR